MLESLLKDAKNVLIISGAGLSKASGIPTFRENTTGLWENHNVDEVSHASADMKKVAAFYQERYRQYSTCKPNEAHYACADLEKFKNVLHVTQNVDGLLQKAGAKNVIEIHGTFSNWTCVDCETLIDPEDGFNCPTCSSTTIRPNVVLFGEMLNEEHMINIMQFLKNKADVIITLGSSGVVYPIANLTAIASIRQIPVISINPARPNNYYDYWIADKCESFLPAIVKDIKDQL